MSNSTAGSAKDVPAGRLANFEDEEPFTPSLPPRPRKKPKSTPRSPKQAPKDPQKQRTADEAPERAPKAAKRSSSTRKASETVPSESRRSSNVHIPVALLERVIEHSTGTGIPHGELIVIAIEGTYDRLPDLIQPPTQTGGKVFASRQLNTAATSPVLDGATTPLNFRLRDSDFAALDGLVERLGARSRVHLITVALHAYLNDPDT